MFNRPPPEALTPFSVLIAATIAFYLRAFRPLFVATATISVALSLAIFALGQAAELDSLPVFVSFTVILISANVAAFSGVFWLAATLRQGHAVLRCQLADEIGIEASRDCARPEQTVPEAALLGGPVDQSDRQRRSTLGR